MDLSALRKGRNPTTKSICHAAWKGQYRSPTRNSMGQFLWGSSMLLRRFGVEKTLQNHSGCVNTISWSSRGDMLASAGDDRRVCLWGYPSGKLISTIETRHSQKIFSVRFLTQSQTYMGCASEDDLVKVFDINRVEREVKTYLCHSGPVKCIENSADDDQVFLTCGRDCTIRRFDLREDHKCLVEEYCSATALVDLMGEPIYSMAVNPMNPNYFVAGGDSVSLRLFDRRFCPKRSVRLGPTQAVRIMTPAQLENDTRTLWRGHAITGVAYSHDGSHVIGSYLEDDIYMFNVEGDTKPSGEHVLRSPISRVRVDASVVMPTAKDVAALENAKGVQLYKAGDYKPAIGHYTNAIHHFRKSPALYCNRAAAYLSRRTPHLHISDCRNALNDCNSALELDSGCAKAYHRKAKALRGLHSHKGALASSERAVTLQPNNNTYRDLFVRLQAMTKRQIARRKEEKCMENCLEDMEDDDGDVFYNEVGDTHRVTPTVGSDLLWKDDRVDDEDDQPCPWKRRYLHKLAGDKDPYGGRRDSGVSEGDRKQSDAGSVAGTSLPTYGKSLRAVRGREIRMGSSHESCLAISLVNSHDSVISGSTFMETNCIENNSEPEQASMPPSAVEAGSNGDEGDDEGDDECDVLYEGETAYNVHDIGGGVGMHSDVQDTPLKWVDTQSPPSSSQVQTSPMACPSSSHRPPARQPRTLHFGQSDKAKSIECAVNEHPTVEFDFDEVSSVDGAASVVDVEGSAQDSEGEGSDAVSDSEVLVRLDPTELDERTHIVYEQRFWGHINRRTLKSVSFLGLNSEYVASGSDDGHIYIWDKLTGELVNVLMKADARTVNCVKAHPNELAIASSGIAHDVKIWTPCMEESPVPYDDILALQANNQKLMREPRVEPQLGSRTILDNLNHGGDNAPCHVM